MVSWKVVVTIVSGIQLILGLILMTVARVGLSEAKYSFGPSGFWWLVGLPFVVVGAVGLVAPKRQTFMGWYLVLNIIGLVLAACWWSTLIDTLRVMGEKYDCPNEVSVHRSVTSVTCDKFRFIVLLVLATGLAAVLCIIGLIMSYRKISDENSVNVNHERYVYTQRFVNPIATPPATSYSAQPIQMPLYGHPTTATQKTSI